MNNNIYTGDFFVYRQFVYMIIKYKTEKIIPPESFTRRYKFLLFYFLFLYFSPKIFGLRYFM